jgi:hypothetical protein
MCDKLVFDLSQEVEGSPNVFIRKDWINILDNQNQNYQNNQSIIDTSQLSNSNKYMSYREAYLAVPLLLSLTTPNSTNCLLAPDPNYGNADYAIGLKNWFGQIIHSFTLDYNGTTIIQQTPFINMWNSFKLLTTLSYGDIITQGSTIGFYPDTASAWTYASPNNAFTAGSSDPPTASLNGVYVCNNDVCLIDSAVSSTLSAIGNRYLSSGLNSNSGGINQVDELGVYQDLLVMPSVALGGNAGLAKRISWINYNPALSGGSSAPYGTLGVSTAACNQIWKSYIIRQVNGITGPLNATCGQMQINVMATIYLKHVHAFFNMIPLLKGVFMKMTMNLNNASSIITVVAATPGVGGGAAATSSYVSTYATSVPVGGVCPLLVPSFRTGSKYSQGSNILVAVNPAGDNPVVQTGGQYWYNLSIGARVVANDNPNLTNVQLQEGRLSKSIYLYVPAYTFNPVFEQAYLSNPIKQIKYTDVYQYQVQNIAGGGNTQFNNLITNGIANIKSVLLIPFYSQNNNDSAYSFNLPSPVYQSPFDTAGCGTTSPMITLGNFNIQISGQNAIYNTQRYTFEEFNNQLYGQNAVNGGLTDGLTSGLIGYQDFLQSYCYYYVNVERMLPVEQSVPKSVQIIGTNYSTQAIDIWVFVEYGVEINIDLQTGARV